MTNYGSLKPLDCACFPNLMASFANKLKPRSIQCVFLGYASHYKGYHNLGSKTDCVYISRDI